MTLSAAITHLVWTHMRSIGLTLPSTMEREEATTALSTYLCPLCAKAKLSHWPLLTHCVLTSAAMVLARPLPEPPAMMAMGMEQLVLQSSLLKSHLFW